MLPGLRNILVGEPDFVEGVDAVIHGHRLDFVRQAIDFPVDHAIGDHAGKEIVARGLLHERRQIEQHAAVVVAQEIAGADDEEVRTRSRSECGRQLGAVHVGVVRHVDEFDLDLVAVVPALDHVLEPFVLSRDAASRRVELPELQRLRSEAAGNVGKSRDRRRRYAAGEDGSAAWASTRRAYFVCVADHGSFLLMRIVCTLKTASPPSVSLARKHRPSALFRPSVRLGEGLARFPGRLVDTSINDGVSDVSFSHDNPDVKKS
jgi:hypothetical protein